MTFATSRRLVDSIKTSTIEIHEHYVLNTFHTFTDGYVYQVAFRTFDEIIGADVEVLVHWSRAFAYAAANKNAHVVGIVTDNSRRFKATYVSRKHDQVFSNETTPLLCRGIYKIVVNGLVVLELDGVEAYKNSTGSEADAEAFYAIHSVV